MTRFSGGLRWLAIVPDRRDCVRLVAHRSGAGHTRPHAPTHSPPLTSLRHTIRRVAIVACLATAACAAPVTADDLVALPASDTTCREIRQDSARASRGLARILMIERLPASMRFVSVGVDSSNHARVFSAMQSRKSGTTMKIQMVGASFDATGRMSQAVRTFMTREMPSGTGDSKSVALSDADTARVRSLTAEVLRRCIR
jgi:FlaG/FlaF family flagellin (archaellin)